MLPCPTLPCAQSRIYNLRETKVIRDLNPADINKLISVSGMVTRTSGVIPDQRCALWIDSWMVLFGWVWVGWQQAWGWGPVQGLRAQL